MERACYFYLLSDNFGTAENQLIIRLFTIFFDYY